MLSRSPIRIDWPTFWGAVSFLLIGGGFAIFGGYQLWTTYSFVNSATPVVATVVENHANCDNDSDCTWRPHLRFNDASGETYEAQTRYGASNYGWNEGTQVEALYNPAFTYLHIAGTGNLYLLGAGFFALGMLAVVVALWLLAKLTFSRGE